VNALHNNVEKEVKQSVGHKNCEEEEGEVFLVSVHAPHCQGPVAQIADDQETHPSFVYGFDDVQRSGPEVVDANSPNSDQQSSV
jgi:hypothetical protein